MYAGGIGIYEVGAFVTDPTDWRLRVGLDESLRTRVSADDEFRLRAVQDEGLRLRAKPEE